MNSEELIINTLFFFLFVTIVTSIFSSYMYDNLKAENQHLKDQLEKLDIEESKS